MLRTLGDGIALALFVTAVVGLLGLIVNGRFDPLADAIFLWNLIF